jgi:hypothetical protein
MLTTSNTRNHPSPHLAPLLGKTNDFLRELVSGDSDQFDPSLGERIRDYLESNPLWNFAPSPDSDRHPLVARPSIPETVEEGETGDSEEDELLMHMSLGDDGQVRYCINSRSLRRSAERTRTAISE